MRAITILSVALLVAVACTMQTPTSSLGDLDIGVVFVGDLEKETPDTFRLNLEADTYIYGIVDQISVDVAISVYDSAGNSIRKFDGPGVGPEPFHFETSDAGEYLIEVAPFEEDTGRYTIELKVWEPIATGPAARTDQLFTPYSGKDVPGGVIGVMKDGELIYSKAYGMANLTHSVPFTTSTPTNIGSVSKQFTAFAILLLEQEGKLSLDDDIRIHIPELPDLGEVITIKNLMNHTNGLREVYNLMPMTGWKGEDMLRREEVINMLTRQTKLQNSPGEAYNYNNSAFIMLAEIVKRKTDTEFPEWMKENVFDSLGMESTVVRTDPQTIIPQASQGYTVTADGLKESGDLAAAFGAGGIYTTVGDFMQWLNNFHDPILGGEELIIRLVKPDTLNNGDTMTYALGIGVGEFKGMKIYSHGGADIAHRAFLMYLPEINAGVAAMSNHASFNSAGIAYEVAEAFFSEELNRSNDGEETDEEQSDGEDSDGEDSEGEEVVVPEKLLNTYAGKYKVTGVGVVIEYKLNDGVLVATMEGQPETALVPKSDSVFAYKDEGAHVEFNLNERGELINAVVHTQNGAEFILLPISPYKAELSDLKKLEGRYFSEELETFYTLELQDSTLMVLIKNTEEIKLNAVEENTFSANVYFINEMVFKKDSRGNAVSFTVSNGRTKGIYFEKL